MTIQYTYEVTPCVDAFGSLRTLTFIIEWDTIQFSQHPIPFLFRRYVDNKKFISSKMAIEWGFNECIKRCDHDTYNR